MSLLTIPKHRRIVHKLCTVASLLTLENPHEPCDGS
nr:MAG TPA: hypothetical protein [Caudoviricetes sp.]